MIGSCRRDAKRVEIHIEEKKRPFGLKQSDKRKNTFTLRRKCLTSCFTSVSEAIMMSYLGLISAYIYFYVI